MSISTHFKEQILRGNVKDLRAKRLTIEIEPCGAELKLVVFLEDGDGLPLAEVATAWMDAKHKNTLSIEGFNNAFGVRLA